MSDCVTCGHPTAIHMLAGRCQYPACRCTEPTYPRRKPTHPKDPK